MPRIYKVIKTQKKTPLERLKTDIYEHYNNYHQNVGDGNVGHLEGKKSHSGFLSVIYNDFIEKDVTLIK